MGYLREGIANLVEVISTVEIKFQILISENRQRKSELIGSEVKGISERIKEENKNEMRSLSIFFIKSRLLSSQ